METEQEAFKFLINKIQAKIPANLHSKQTFPHIAPEVTNMIASLINFYKEQDVFLPEAFKTVLQQVQFTVYKLTFGTHYQIIPNNAYTIRLTLDYLYKVQPENIYTPPPAPLHHQAIIEDLSHGL